MTADSVFNHIGLCVTDLSRSRAFYENALSFDFWRALGPIPDAALSKTLQLEEPIGLQAVYLVRDGLVLELLQFLPERTEPARRRSMAEPGLTHLSLSVADLDEASERVERNGGSVIRETRVDMGVMIRDPDGQLIELLPYSFLDSLPSRPADPAAREAR